MFMPALGFSFGSSGLLQSPLACTEKRYCDRRQAKHWPSPVKKDIAGQEGGSASLVAVEVLAEPVAVAAVGTAVAVDGGALARMGAQISAAVLPLGSLRIAWATSRQRMESPAAAAKSVSGSLIGRGEP